MAKRFRFRLEVVRKLREQGRDAQRRVVADALRALNSVEERIDRLTQELRGTLQRARSEQRVERLDVASLRAHQYYRSWLHRKIMEAGIELNDKTLRLDRERTKLGEASARLKAIERLRERRWQRHRILLRREDQSTTDESALQLHQRQAGRGSHHGEWSPDEHNGPDAAEPQSEAALEVR